MANKSEIQNQTKCVNFEECPLCYKCRGFKPASNKCLKCSTEICTRDTHTPKNINMMITRPIVKAEEKIYFQSFTK